MPPATPSAPAAAPADDVHTVTLITGDRFQVTTGRHPRATLVQSAPGTTAYSVFPAGDALYVLPDQAMPLLAAERVDKQLFNVTGLVAQGYDDAATPALPVIVQYASADLVPHAAPAGVRTTRALPAIHAAADEVLKSKAGQFWQTLTSPSGFAPSGTKLWLDAQVRASDDVSAAQIGAPAAWQRGLDGTGVTVAVLDSGIDTSHPDLASQVVGSHNFTDETDADDHVGHGTHVASIIAGTGAASGGQYAGVAHGAKVLNDKVMELGFVGPGIPEGVGRESWILAGMQWAVDQGARIVNMSLGNDYPDGNDPLSLAVNALSQQYGTLFVVSAGNNGPDHYTVGGPAAADDALAVGSVDRDDSISFFSSRGPRMIDGLLKPDVTAPGNDIIGARAAHGRIGRFIDQNYVALSGTSMAAPHVAASAAILLQQHPDWTRDQLWAALTSTAAYNPNTDAYSQGAGRIDVDRATRQQVDVDGTLELGYFAAGNTHPVASKPLTYYNDSATPVTLTLAAGATDQSGAPAPKGTLTVTPRKLTVPAGGQADATVALDLEGRPAGAYSGRVTASGPDGVALGTTVGFVQQGQEVQATFRAVDRTGRPAEAFLILRDPRNPFSFLVVDVPPGGSHTIQADPGDYSILGYVRTPYRDADGATDYNAALTVVADPDLELTQPNPTITYDARRARPLDVRVPRDVDVNGLTVGLQVERPGTPDPLQDSLLFARGPSYGSIPAVPMSVLPFDPPRLGHGEFDSYWSLVSPRARASVVSPWRGDLPVRLMDGSARLDGSQQLSVVDAGSGDFTGVDATGKLALVRQTAGVSFTDQAAAAQQAGAVALLVSAAEPGPFFGTAYADIPVLAISRADGDRLRAASGARARLSGTSSSTYLYDLAFREHDRISRSTVYHPSNLAEVRSSYYADDTRGRQRFWQLRFPAYGTVCGYCANAAREGEDWNGAVTRTEYVTARIPWQEALLQDSWLQWAAVRSYPSGADVTSWGKAPVVPGVPIAAGVISRRVDDQLQLRLSGYTDADPTHVTSVPSYWFNGSAVLARDGEPVTDCVTSVVLSCDADVPAGRATYTLTVDEPAPVFTDSVQSSTTTWTFRSQRGEPTLPLIDLDYDLPVRPDNTLRAGTHVRMLLGATRQPGSTGGRIAAPRVQASFDGGATWTSAPVAQARPGEYKVTLALPQLAATDGFLALRVSARDDAGDAIAQEVPRAVRLTG